MDNQMSLVLSMLENLNKETVHGLPAKAACNRLKAAIELREKLLAEQKVKIGQGGRKVYKIGLDIRLSK